MKQSVKRVVLLFASCALVSIPGIAQQEVSPDHFENAPSVATKKAAGQSHKAAAKTPNNNAVRQASVKPKSGAVPQSAPVLKADARPATR